jgi:predicted component of type VI protein secretion system
MTKEQKQLVKQVKEELSRLLTINDNEAAHEQADILIANLLSNIGLKDVADMYKKIPKWYA